MSASAEHEALLAELTRRGFLARSAAVGLGALVAAATPWAAASSSAAGNANTADATLQAFADTIIPGRRVAQTESGAAIDPSAIAGVDPLAGAVEADALALYHHPEVGFDALEAPFLSELETRSLTLGGDFLHLSFDRRVQVCLAGLDLSNQTVLVWEAAAAIPFTAFCAAALVRDATAATAVGYAVMGLPGTAPGGYADFSFRRALSRERTSNGSLP
jgi:hypothetical protein